MLMKKLQFMLLILPFLFIGYGWSELDWTLDRVWTQDRVSETKVADDPIAIAFRNHQSGVQVKGVGIVDRVLPDDNEGKRHQRFIVRLGSGQTLLIAHNIGLAPRVSPLNPGDTISFYGVFEWNAKGGVVHWTHHDPGRRHKPGWLKRNGVVYR